MAAQNLPTKFPTYDNSVNSEFRSDGVNEADEMNLYSPNPLLDSPFGPSDLEWLYRQQDVDGASLTSRLSQLAPISFTNTIDGPRRRRLVALDSWETNSFVWANDNPGNAFANNSRFNTTQNAGFANVNTKPNNNNLVSLFTYTPSLALRDRKINLNYPLPVSNDCNEPIRQKWISDAYRLIKAILPPDSVDTAEELAQLSQFVINIIDFRDPDATMTHWRNPDVYITPGTATPPTYPTLSFAAINGNSVLLDQYGMEYNPVAINETLAYTFQSRLTKSQKNLTLNNRFFIELVNTLTAAYNPTFDYGTTLTYPANNYYGYGPSFENTSASYTTPTTPNQASTLGLGGLSYTANDPYGGGCWDLVFTADNPMSRPDPYRGELLYNPTAGGATYFGLIPLNRDSLTTTSGGPGGPNATAPNQGDATLLPISPTATTVTGTPLILPTVQTSPPTTYYYVIANPSGAANSEIAPLGPFADVSTNQGPGLSTGRRPTSRHPVPDAHLRSDEPRRLAPLHQVAIAGDPADAAPRLPDHANQQFCTNYQFCLGHPVPGKRHRREFGRPGQCVSIPVLLGLLAAPRQSLCPRVGGQPDVRGRLHAVPLHRWKWDLEHDNNPSGLLLHAGRGSRQYDLLGAAAPAVSRRPRRPDARTTRGRSICPRTRATATPTRSPCRRLHGSVIRDWNGKYKNYGLGRRCGRATTNPATNAMYHTLGTTNDSAENWDYLVFNDRDFSSVAELMLVPGCPPGLFTKQFVEFAPSQTNAADIFSLVNTLVTPAQANVYVHFRNIVVRRRRPPPRCRISTPPGTA